MMEGDAVHAPAISPAMRLAARADLPALEWGGELSRYHRLYIEVFRRMEQGEALIWIAELPAEGLIGQVFVQLQSQRGELADGLSRAYVYGFRVRQPFRRRGVGAFMMDWIENDLARRGFQWVTLNVSRANADARRLYERLNYRVIGEDAGNWHYVDENGLRHDVHEPSWRMEKNLLATTLHPC